jgi:Glycosyl transferases group 1
MKVLFLTQTGEMGPSSRYRVYQLVPFLREQGIDCEISPAIDDLSYRRLYLNHTRRAPRRAAFAEAWRRRQADLEHLDSFNAVFVQKGVFPGLYSGFERKITARKPLVFDFDDAIWLPRQGGSPLLRALHRERTVQDVLRSASAVIAGNGFLAEYAQRFNRNVTIVPSTVDTNRYLQSAGSPIVGWIGSSTTLPYLNQLALTFSEMNLKPRVIASGDPEKLEFACDFRQWRMETEFDELSQIGIGVAPLPDTPWEHGKCGVKVLQYMACGIPVVASPVGVHNQIVQHGNSGFLARSPEEWKSYLTELLHDPQLRARLGNAGREIVRRNYDVRQAAERLASVLQALQLASAHTSGIAGKLNRKSA